MVLICPNCGRRFSVTKGMSHNRKFCSPLCTADFYHHHGKKHREYIPGDEILREFNCRECGRRVRIVEKRDQRTVFCSQQCEKKYWREKMRAGESSRSRGGNLGMSGGMSLGSLIRREARDLS